MINQTLVGNVRITYTGTIGTSSFRFVSGKEDVVNTYYSSTGDMKENFLQELISFFNIPREKMTIKLSGMRRDINQNKNKPTRNVVVKQNIKTKVFDIDGKIETINKQIIELQNKLEILREARQIVS